MKANIPPLQIGDKVVVTECLDPEMRCPVFNTEVCIIIDKCHDYEDSYVLKNYETAFDGLGQSFHYEHLRKVEEQKAPLLTFEKIKEEEKEEVLIIN